MGKNKDGRPEWFKFWRRNRRQLDIEQLDMQSRGVVFTNMMRYFDGEDSALLDMSPIESMAFNVLKINVDDSFSEYAEREKTNRENGRKGGRPAKTEQTPENPMGFEKTQKTRRKKTEVRGQKTEGRGQKEEVRGGTEADKPPVHPYGQYGWVKLTDEQHAKLLADLGAEELDRCITLVDESAQANGNRNGWKDWNLVIRKCHRDGWGKGNKHESTSYHSMPTGSSGKRFNIKYDVE